MHATKSVTISGSLVPLVMLSRLLQRLESSAEPVSPDQYRSVVERLSGALLSAPQGEGFDAVLEAYPAARELYENLNYQHAGLCRSPLDASMRAELEAGRVMARFARGAAAQHGGPRKA